MFNNSGICMDDGTYLSPFLGPKGAELTMNGINPA
jgi:hypothetical protein